MKKIGIIIAVVLVVAVFAAVFVFATQNYRLLWSKVKDMRSIIKSYENIELIETKSVYGKLNGNGNGIDFFGAALVTADSEESVKALTALLDEKFWAAEYSIQTEKEIKTKYLVHEKLSFDYDFDESDDTYYLVFFFENDKRANLMDLKGH